MYRRRVLGGQAGRRGRRTWRRTKAGLTLAVTRAQLRVLEAVAPAAAERKAIDLWCTLPPGARTRDYRPSAGTVTRLPAPRGGDVVVETWGEGPTVYLVHGWGGWRGQLGAFVGPLVEAGYRAAAIDAPGHGEAAPGFRGKGRGTVMEMMDALEVTGRELGPAAGVIAHSLGTTAAAHVVAESLSTRRLALVAPNYGFEEVVRRFVGVLRLNERTTNALRASLEEATGRALADYDLGPLGADGTMPDTLVVHDRHDKECPYSVGASVAAAWPNGRLMTTSGLGHQRILADAAVVAAVVAHVVEPALAG